MSHEEQLQALRKYLKVRNKRYTVERESILELISDIEGRFSIVDLYQKAKKRSMVHAASTLYRNIYTFVDAGFLTEIRLREGETVFESNLNNKSEFMLCVGCGRLVRIDLPALEGLENRICKEYKFTPTSRVYQLRGYCEDCNA